VNETNARPQYEIDIENLHAALAARTVPFETLASFQRFNARTYGWIAESYYAEPPVTVAPGRYATADGLSGRVPGRWG
jgi:hypothetical protein